MKVLIVGASGLVGSHCFGVFETAGWIVRGTHISFATPRTTYFNPSVEELEDNTELKDFLPDIIVHCGALTNVDYCETHVVESYDSTVKSVQQLVNYCHTNNTFLIYISTDYVFDGKAGPYHEDAPVNPINVYGQHKLEAEKVVQTLPDYLIARVTNVYGEESRAKNFVERLVIWLRDNEQKKLNLPTDQFATPIYAGDIASMLALLVKDGKKGIYHFGSTDYYTRVQLAEKLKKNYKGNTSVEITGVTTDLLKQPAQRPLNGGLLNNKFSKEYPYYQFTNIDSYLLKKGR